MKQHKQKKHQQPQCSSSTSSFHVDGVRNEPPSPSEQWKRQQTDIIWNLIWLANFSLKFYWANTTAFQEVRATRGWRNGDDAQGREKKKAFLEDGRSGIEISFAVETDTTSPVSVCECEGVGEMEKGECVSLMLQRCVPAVCVVRWQLCKCQVKVYLCNPLSHVLYIAQSILVQHTIQVWVFHKTSLWFVQNTSK